MNVLFLSNEILGSVTRVAAVVGPAVMGLVVMGPVVVRSAVAPYVIWGSSLCCPRCWVILN